MMNQVESSIVVGAAKRVINPAPSIPLMGFPPRRDNTGVGMDLCVRAMLFGSPGGETPSAGLVVLDSLGVGADMVRSIREHIARAVGGLEAEAIMVAATHTHSAPALRAYGRKDRAFKPDPKYVELVIAESVGAAADAWNARRETKMRVGTASADLGHNRRVVDENGKATNVWKDAEGEHTGFFLPDVPFVSFERDDGAPAAMLVSYGCHPVTLGPGSTLASPDYPGYFVRRLEADTGAATVVHVTGGGADINPKLCLFDEPDETKRMGETLAAAVEGKLSDAAVCQAGPIATASVPLELVVSDTASKNFFAGSAAVDTAGGKVLVTEVQAIRLGDLVLVSAPGELFAEIAAGIRKSSPFRHTVVVSYADDYLGYLFTDKSREEGGYEPRNPVSENIEQPLLAAAKRAMDAAKRE